MSVIILEHIPPQLILDFEKLLERGLDAARQLTNPETHPLEFVTTPGKKWLVKADTARMEQVILNLLENALKYSPDGGVIRVKLREYAAGEPLPVAGLELSIQDSGLGLEPEDLEHLFERYHRTRNGNHNISGLGLGLYISAEIVRQHNGRIWATSPGAGQGSTFYLALPTIKDEGESQKSEVRSQKD
jgi:signal transduction histidine kinase